MEVVKSTGNDLAKGDIVGLKIVNGKAVEVKFYKGVKNIDQITVENEYRILKYDGIINGETNHAFTDMTKKIKPATRTAGKEGKRWESRDENNYDVPQEANNETSRIVQGDEKRFLKFSNKPEADSWGRKKFEGWNKNLLTSERQAIYDYTANDFYENINRVLRGIEDKFNAGNHERVKQITNALNKASIDDYIIVYRGVGKDLLESFGDLPYEKLIGMVIDERAFLSTSLVKEGCFNKPVLLEIRVPKGAKGAYIGNISKYGLDEVEILFDQGQKMVIQQAGIENGKIMLILEMLQ